MKINKIISMQIKKKETRDVFLLQNENFFCFHSDIELKTCNTILT